VSTPSLLLVDDAPDLGAVVTALGRRCGCAVACRPDAASAWEYLQTARPDLVLLDVGLPGESGLELCRRLRAAPGLADLKVALFSHWGLPADVADGMDAGADFLISKDLVCRPDEWRRRLGEALAWRRGLRAAGPAPRPGPNWVARTNQALAHPSLRRAGPDVARVLLRRALREAFPAEAGAEGWLAPGGAALDAGRLPALPPEAVADLVGSLADLAWRLLGADESAAFRAALAGAVTTG
jgi:CheY-like chemotaxis protein